MPPITLDGTLGITTPSYGGADTAEYLVPVTAFKNRIINGAMVIDQRNAGASVTITNTAALTYTVDRWAAYGSAASKFSVQQDAGAVTPPVGFTDYLGVTSLSAYSISSSDTFQIQQSIEGFNIADLGWGTANAATVTVSFWVRSSLTGTFGGSLRNSATNRSYPFSYTISSANTWEQKSITVAGDTSGTWLTTNGIGLILTLGIGIGSTLSGTAGAWAASDFRSATGATSVVGTNGATFYITGVQLEVGSTATSFDYRPYGTELALCQRYYEKSFNQATAPAHNIATNFFTGGAAYNAGLYVPAITFAVVKRAVPTVTLYSTNSGSTSPSNGQWQLYQSSWASRNAEVQGAFQSNFNVNITSGTTNNNGYAIAGNWVAESEL